MSALATFTSPSRAMRFIRKLPGSGLHRIIVLALVLLLAGTLIAIFSEAKKSGKTVSQVVSDAFTGTQSVFGGLLRKVVIGFGLAIAAALALAAAPAWAMGAAAVAVLAMTGAYTVSAGLLHLPELPKLGSSSGGSSSAADGPDPCVTGPYMDASGTLQVCTTYGGSWQG